VLRLLGQERQQHHDVEDRDGGGDQAGGDQRDLTEESSAVEELNQRTTGVELEVDVAGQHQIDDDTEHDHAAQLDLFATRAGLLHRFGNHDVEEEEEGSPEPVETIESGGTRAGHRRTFQECCQRVPSGLIGALYQDVTLGASLSHRPVVNGNKPCCQDKTLQ
jgi:hypothetical protein